MQRRERIVVNIKLKFEIIYLWTDFRRPVIRDKKFEKEFLLIILSMAHCEGIIFYRWFLYCRNYKTAEIVDFIL